MQNAIIIGGGFYGAAIAHYLKSTRHFPSVLLVEREGQLLAKASYNNQARVHNGYHYPRSYTTAFRSRVNLPRFVQDYPQAVKRDFTKLYAIARDNSKVTARQFQRFCREIGASLSPAPGEFSTLFNPRLIEAVYLAEEYAFDALKLRHWAETALAQVGAEVWLNRRVAALRQAGDSIGITLNDGEELAARYVFNCTYSGLNQFGGEFPGTASRLKHEITEMALAALPEPLCRIGITVMDGPFFSMMPFPARGALHTLSHVRYTPHFGWQDIPGSDPYRRLAAYHKTSRADRMLRDVARYLPAIEGTNVVDSLFEVKTVLVKNESDDGRPILFERHPSLPGCYSVLGGKIDNIYDVLEKLDAEKLPI